MEKIPLGTKVRALGINRSNVADGQTGRAVLIDNQPRFKYIAFDDKIKRRVEVNQEMVISYGLSPITYYFYLIARLNTDLNGNVIGTKFTVEYLQLSENVNNEFSDMINEQGGAFTQLRLNKVSKKGGDGRDFGYIKPIPSNQPVDQEIIDSINKIRQEPGAVDAMWALVDRASSITPEEYKQLKEQSGDTAQPVRQVSAPSSRMQISGPAPTMPQAPEGFGDKFGEAAEFDNI